MSNIGNHPPVKLTMKLRIRIHIERVEPRCETREKKMQCERCARKQWREKWHSMCMLECVCVENRTEKQTKIESQSKHAHTFWWAAAAAADSSERASPSDAGAYTTTPHTTWRNFAPTIVLTQRAFRVVVGAPPCLMLSVTQSTEALLLGRTFRTHFVRTISILNTTDQKKKT